MAKLTAWLVTLVGVLLVLPLLGVSQLDALSAWLVPLSVLAVGIGKLVRNYSSRRR
jgi:purine-cytosine permease-like protein